MTSALTPALSPGKREDHLPACSMYGFSRDFARFMDRETETVAGNRLSV